MTPDVLIWARERSRLDVEAVAHLLRVDANLVEQWENGSSRPTVPQARKLAEIYKRPVAVFFLSSPPKDFSVIEEYRVHRLSENESASKALSLELQSAQETRDNLIDIADEKGDEFLPFKLTSNLDHSIVDTAVKIRSQMGISRSEQINWKSTDIALRHWINSVENLDVLVFQSSKFDVREARGFSIFNEILPIILLNGKDAPAGKIFTLIHELVHLSLVKDNRNIIEYVNQDGNKGKTQDKKIEEFCDNVASEIILPQEMFAKYISDSRQTIDLAFISTIARHFSVSRDMVLLRLRRHHYITFDKYLELKNSLDKEYEAIRLAKIEKSKSSPGAAPPHYMTLRDLGITYTRVVLEALNESVISASTASGLLRLKTKHFDKLSDALMDRMTQVAS
ncbi:MULTISPECIES: XRE family transcriptional regulator [Deinococcus]|uniref:XRE family transcriptional regulator n=1 Tax=Deinococcus rufus TaxID=2136097 RepID=A0ABV7Z412_9DEIO|nr:XRE family transcriptional regulator [Deinococcus sp. AB2017081]WQE95485.1 XRE family transcriptional regulator [Deinococcus sp. AB2017081]